MKGDTGLYLVEVNGEVSGRLIETTNVVDRGGDGLRGNKTVGCLIWIILSRVESGFRP